MIKNWKSSLHKYGFEPDVSNRAVLAKKIGFLEQSITEVRLRLLPGKLVVRLGVGYTDNLRNNPFVELLVMADLRRGESPSHDGPGETWRTTEDRAALNSLVKYGLPWLAHFGQPAVLVDYYKKQLKERNAPGDHRALSLLYYELGDKGRFCEQADLWLASISTGSSWAEERERTHRRMKKMGCADEPRDVK
jgi:hypothetical protein